MAFYKYKGKRIRASDKNLVYCFCAGTLLFPVHSGSPATEHGDSSCVPIGSISVY